MQDFIATKSANSVLKIVIMPNRIKTIFLVLHVEGNLVGPDMNALATSTMAATLTCDLALDVASTYVCLREEGLW